MMPATEPPAFVWSAPATDRYRGSFDHAVDLLVGSGVATRYILEHLTEDRGARCRIRAIRQGEHFEAMLFGADGVIRNVVADPERWPATTPRAALECTDGLGNALVQPVACGNWSFELVRPDNWFALTPPDIALTAPPTMGPDLASSGSWLPWTGLGAPGSDTVEFDTSGASHIVGSIKTPEPRGVWVMLTGIIALFAARLRRRRRST